jgi:hypothetical protein
MRKIVFAIATLIISAGSNVLLAAEQFDTHHPFFYVSVPLTAVSKPNQPLAELGFAIRQSDGLMTAYSDSSRQLPMVNLTFTSQGLRNWSAFGIDVTKLGVNGNASVEAEDVPAAHPVVLIVGGILLAGLVVYAVGNSVAESAAPNFAPRTDISVSIPPLPPPSTPPPSSATWR